VEDQRPARRRTPTVQKFYLISKEIVEKLETQSTFSDKGSWLYEKRTWWNNLLTLLVEVSS
jgi:hypothetical protein